MASSTSTSTSSNSGSKDATDISTLTSQPTSSEQVPWAPGISNRSLRHQRDTGFVYNEDHEESLFNDSADLPSQLELADELCKRLLEVEERQQEDRRFRDRFWEQVARGDYLMHWVRYTRVELEEMRGELGAGREQGGEVGGDGDGFETATVTGGGIDETEEQQQQQQQTEDEDGSDGEPNWTSLETEMEAAEFE